MIKGVNKKIVDIKCTNNEYFERALLFVNSRCMFSDNENEELAKKYIACLTDEISDDGGYFPAKRSFLKKTLFAAIPWLIAVTALAAAIKSAL
ncbi:hypothetical protein [uncultured Ruminococcus sp.]|uniref:hypothetical protein n=1 Tax=uncultured Ruminococcus sp. TaxID=165186 RepID=UPI000ED89CA3|nr:hypothetical protein [uncultured Ruminococcus sp.]HCJ41824.1 hypothetical protein [Ruminococcus sp.]